MGRLFSLAAETYSVPSNLLISSGGQNFVTLAAKLCDNLASLFQKISKFSRTNFPFNIFLIRFY